MLFHISFIIFIIFVLIFNYQIQNNLIINKKIREKKRELMRLIYFIGIKDIELLNIIKINKLIDDIMKLNKEDKNKIIQYIIIKLIKKKKKHNLKYFINDINNFLIIEIPLILTILLHLIFLFLTLQLFLI